MESLHGFQILDYVQVNTKEPMQEFWEFIVSEQTQSGKQYF